MNGNGESQEQIDASDAEALSSPLDNDGGINTEAVQTPDPIEVLRKENEELKDRILRLIAETENMRRRSRREIADARQFSIANFARDMLAVGDNLRRAIESITPEMRENTGESWAALIGGVEMTEREMLNKMQGHGVKLLDPQGTQFDPHFHQAMFEIPDPSVPAGTVLQVVQSGYVIGERMLRPAMVGIAKDGPKLAGEMKADQQRGDDAEPASQSDRQPEGESSDSESSDSEPYDRKPANDASADHDSVNLYEQATQKSGEESSVDRKV